jgi:hypothetical protein
MTDITPERRARLEDLARMAYPEPDTYESDEERVFGLICELIHVNVLQSIEGASSVSTILDLNRETVMIVDSVLENVTEEGWRVTRR